MRWCLVQVGCRQSEQGARGAWAWCEQNPDTPQAHGALFLPLCRVAQTANREGMIIASGDCPALRIRWLCLAIFVRVLSWI